MKSISKSDIKRRDEIVAKLQAGFEALEDDHRVLKEAVDLFNSKVVEFNEIILEANNFAEDIAREIESYIDDRSEKWHEGDRADAYSDWKTAWEDVNMEDLDEVSVDDLEAPSIIEALENAPVEPEG